MSITQTSRVNYGPLQLRVLNLASENVDEGAAQNAADLITATLIAAKVAGVDLDELHRCIDSAAPVVDEAFRTRPDLFGGPVLQ